MTTKLDPKIDVNPVDANRFDTTEEILKSFQGNSKVIDRTKKAFEVAAASARKNGQPLNTLHLLAALMCDFSALAVNEVADPKKISMKDLIQRCKVAARVADAATAEEWRNLASTTEFASKQWKHNFIGPDHSTEKTPPRFLPLSSIPRHQINRNALHFC